MNERLIQLRNYLHLSQEELGSRIGLSRFTISNYESGKRTITNRVIADLCREFNVNEHWLRTGEGEMLQDSNKSILGELTARFKLDDLDIRILEAYLKLPTQQRAVIKNFIAGIAVPDMDWTDLEVEAYRSELEAEKKEKTSSVSEELEEKSKMA